MYWQPNFDAVMSLMKEAKEQGAPAILCTVRGSVHINQSDFSILYKNTTSFVFKATVNPQRAIDLNIRFVSISKVFSTDSNLSFSASLEFLRDVTSGAGKSIIQRCLTDEALLQMQPLEQIPTTNKPKQQWIAARLRIKHEFRTRVATGMRREMKRHIKGEEHNVGDELWMHVKPESAELRRWRLQHRCTIVQYSDTDADAEGEEPKREASSCRDESQSSTENDVDALREVDTQDTWLGAPPALKKELPSDGERPTVHRR